MSISIAWRHAIVSVWLPLAWGSSCVGDHSVKGGCVLQTRKGQRTAAGVKDEFRVAVLLRGESFRLGGRTTRAIGNHDEQLDATQSQLDNLVLPLENAGMAVDVFSATDNTPWVEELIDKWHGRLRTDQRLDHDTGSQELNAWLVVSATANYAREHGLSYDMVVVLRHDMHLKKNLGKIITDLVISNGGRFDQFLVPFKMTKEYRWFPDRVPDTLQIMAGQFFAAFQNMLDYGSYWPYEQIWVRMEESVRREHMGFVEQGFFGDSDPWKACNPLYKFAGRGEGGPMPQELFTDSSKPKLK